MRFRARHLACLLVLLSAIGVAANAQGEPAVFRGSYIDVLLYRHAAEASSHAAVADSARLPGDEPADTETLPSRDRASLRLVWTIAPSRSQAPAHIAHTSILRA